MSPQDHQHFNLAVTVGTIKLLTTADDILGVRRGLKNIMPNED